MSETRELPILRRRKNDLPDDIVLNILTRLPAKSVIRFRCVCKTWDSSITTPNFISTHLNNFAHDHDNDNGDGYIIHMPLETNSSNRAVCTVAFDRTFDRISEIEVPFDLPSGSIQIVGSCNGLLCIACTSGLDISDYVIYLWNPSIRKFKRLPDSCLGKLGFVTLGFAYHSENNDYKVLRISSYSIEGSPIPDKVEVYTLSLDSWRRVGMSLRANLMELNYCSLLPLPLVSGALHWISCVVEGEEERKSVVIVSFDVNSEEFRMLRIPDGAMSTVGYQTRLASFKGKLAFLTGVDQYSIWVMREYGVLESWNKLFVVPLERFPHCIAFTMCGSLLTHYRETNNREEKFVLVDTETLHEKDFDIQQPLSVATFMESLTLLDGANMVSY
ncbi:F-box protein CPR1-like isoform X4 [Quercus robur]|uniref:F-box protein CPR1-like isoform X4 n=1 Tax=Quercus robur TaxID=38942 RepID=UPI0021624F02|nr:F-box protein CPR1-like isoform X4 [Quercus robur]